MSVAASGLPAVRRSMMANRFKVGDRVTWNSEAGHVSGTIIKVHTEDVNYKGHTHRASEDDPQYEIKSSKTEHIAMHRGAVLKHAKA
jgi:Hypervirulence associated proteins TUDOR domain